ncbi:MAG: hypothetical protein JO187_05790, partial [Acidobacteria bacterium]|nr:hypothetical protein [Acidobacteriota bacterium]
MWKPKSHAVRVGCVPALLLVLFAAQSLWFIPTQSLTYDEVGHIYAGLDAWQHGRF